MECETMSKQISSVDYLISQVEDFIGLIPSDIIETAKAMHKQEIEEHHTWLLSGVMPEESARKDAEDYYKQTFEQ